MTPFKSIVSGRILRSSSGTSDARADLTRRALRKKHAITEQLADIDEQIGRLQATQEQLIERQMQPRGQIEGFRVRKEVLKARHGAAEASARATEAFTGVGGEMADVQRAMERATERTEQMELQEMKGNVSRELEAATT